MTSNPEPGNTRPAAPSSSRIGAVRRRGYNSSGLLEREAAFVERYFPARGHVVVTAAGGGREAIALLERGYEVSAFECNPRHGRGKEIAPGEALLPNCVHYFTPEEIEDEMREAGLQLLSFEAGDYGWAVGQSSRGPKGNTP